MWSCENDAYHWQYTRSGVLQSEVFIFEFVAIDGFAACSIVVGEIAGLAHEIWNDTMECWALVTETFFTGTQCTEVFSCFWNNIATELKWIEVKQVEESGCYNL